MASFGIGHTDAKDERPILGALLLVPVVTLVGALLAALVIKLRWPELRLPIEWYGTPAFPLFRDFNAHFRAASLILAGKNAQDWGWYLGPPVFPWLLTPLAILGFPAASFLFQCVTILPWPVGLLRAAWARPRRWRDVGLVSLWLATSAPFVWAIQRANVDPFLALLVAGALLALGRSRERLAGALIALAASVKYYALLFVLPLEALGMRRAANAAYVSFALLFVGFGPANWLRPFAKKQMTERLGYLMPDFNLSTAHIWWSCARWLGIEDTEAAIEVFPILWLGSSFVLMTICLIADSRRCGEKMPIAKVDEWALYAVFAFGFPRQIYPYAGLLTLPLFFVVLRLWQSSESQAARRCLLGLAIALGCQQSQAGALAALLSAVEVPCGLIRNLDSIGSLAAMVFVTLWKGLDAAKRSPQPKGMQPV